MHFDGDDKKKKKQNYTEHQSFSRENLRFLKYSKSQKL